MAGKRSSAAQAVRRTILKPLYKGPCPRSFQSPPLGLDILIVVCYVRIFHISPEADGGGKVLPHSLVFPYTFFTMLNKRFKAVPSICSLPSSPRPLLYLQLHRKSVRIPAGLSRYHIALHCPVSRNHIFNDTRQHMADMGVFRWPWGAVIECVGFALFTAVDAFFKRSGGLPKNFSMFFSLSTKLRFVETLSYIIASS